MNYWNPYSNDIDDWGYDYASQRAYYENTQRQANKAKESKIEIDVTPKYTPPQRRFPKFRRHSVHDLKIGLIGGMHMASKVMNLTHLTAEDTVFITVKGEGEECIPDSILNRIAKGTVVVIYSDNTYYQASRRIRREYWSLKRLLWECLKESQYVEFEEITG